jgi:hypothetical protein
VENSDKILAYHHKVFKPELSKSKLTKFQMSRKSILFGLLAIAVILGTVTAVAMVSATTYMNGAAAYARVHTADLTIPQPLPGSEPFNEPPTKVESVARYGDIVEIQVTRRYRTAQSPEAFFTTTYFYAPSGDTWQVVPPPESFWGDIKTTKGTYTAITHPQRDQKLIDNLIIALDAALETACERWECPPATQPVLVRFVTDPAATGPLTYLVPRITGIPMSRDANTDYISSIAAHAVIDLADQLGLPAADGLAEVQRQNLYLYLR